MHQHRFIGYWVIRLSALTIAALLLGMCPIPAADANSIKNPPPIALRLVDGNGNLVTSVKLSARYAGGNKVQSHGKADKTGIIWIKLPPGRYYFTGDVSILNFSPVYSANFNGSRKMMFYYISEPIDITESTSEITLTINSANYVDVADIAGRNVFKLHVNQDELGINTDIDVRSTSDGVRLYMPMRKIYEFGNTEGVCHLKWPVYAAPGLLVVLSAT